MNAMIRLLAWIVAVALVALPVAAVLNGWIAGDRWPMQRLVVNGAFERVQAEQVRAAVLPHARAGFFAVRLPTVRAAVARLPWVERVEVRKHWPDLLDVVVVEHRPFARWGEERVLSESGRLFVAPVGDPGLAQLPRLDGPDARIQEIVALYRQAQQVFAEAGERVRSVSLSTRGSWSLLLQAAETTVPAASDAAAGVDAVSLAPAALSLPATEIVVGRSDAGPRIARFARLMPRLIASEQRRLLRADLRYTNGFSLIWQGLATAADGVSPLPPGPAAAQANP